jgi:hypothetical protein
VNNKTQPNQPTTNQQPAPTPPTDTPKGAAQWASDYAKPTKAGFYDNYYNVDFLVANTGSPS